MSEIADGRADGRLARSRPVGGSTKRLIDIVLATTGIVLLLPLYSVCTLGTLLSSRGSILARHRRVGFRGCYFDCLKFKTMAPNGNERLHEDLGANPRAALGYAQTRKLGYGPRGQRFVARLRETGFDAFRLQFYLCKVEMMLLLCPAFKHAGL